MKCLSISAIGVATSALALTLFVQFVRAAGIPETGALTYTGYLQKPDGAEIVQKVNIAVSIWDAASSGNKLCEQAAAGLQLVSGHFQLALPDKCAAEIRKNPNLWIEVEVDGAALARTKLGAVPYAIEATHATQADTATNAASASLADNAKGATGELKNQLDALGSRVSADVAMYINTHGNNGTVSCDTFCANLDGMWTQRSGTCAAAQLRIRTASLAKYDNKFVPCSTVPAAAFTGWSASAGDWILCHCFGSAN